MTISDNLSRWSYPGEIDRTDFPYSNKIFTKSDLKVYVDSLLQSDSLYSVTGIGAEAGGKVTNFNGDLFDINEKEILASNSIIHSQMVDTLSLSKNSTN